MTYYREPQFLSDIIEYPSLPGASSWCLHDARSPRSSSPLGMDANIRPGGGYIQSSPGTFNSAAGNPFLGSQGGQPNPLCADHRCPIALSPFLFMSCRLVRWAASPRLTISFWPSP